MLSSACSRKCLRAGAGISKSRAPEQGAETHFSPALWASYAGHTGSPPFLGHTAEEVLPATTRQPEKSVLAGGIVAGESPATVKASPPS